MRKRQYINPRTIVSDITAGLVVGIVGIPDSMASGLLAAINPINAVYAAMLSMPVGAIFASSVFISVQTTSAMSMIIASVPEIHQGEGSLGFLLALSILAGVIMLALGLLKLGSLIRFVPNAVMVGFINAVALLIILGQLGDLTGYSSDAPNKVSQTIDILFNLDKVDLPSLAVGAATMFMIITLEKTRMKAFGMVAAILAGSMLVPLFDWDSVVLVGEIAEIPSSLPRIQLPPLSAFPAMLIPAISLAFVGLVQGSGVSKTYLNPDGTFPDTSGDFVGQGAANIAAGLLQGMPVGGSVSGTALVINSGAKTRFANIIAGGVIAVLILLFGNAIGSLAMPALAGLLIIVGFRTLKPDEIEMVWKTGSIQKFVMVLTFVATLFIPLQYAVMLGVVGSIFLFVIQQSNEITVKQWIYGLGGQVIERDAPLTLPQNQIIILVPYGSLFFATASLFEEKLPDIISETRNTAVILNLRGKHDLGSTFLNVLERYAEDLQENSCRLMLAETNPEVILQLEKTGIIKAVGRENIFRQTEIVGESTNEAYDLAEKWVQVERIQPDRENSKQDEPS